MRVGEIINCRNVEYLLEASLVQASGRAAFKARDLSTGAAAHIAFGVARHGCDLFETLRETALVRELAHGISPPAATSAPTHPPSQRETQNAEPFVITEWIEGETLEARLARAPLAVEEVVRVGRALTGALAALHEKRLTHGALRPENVWFVRADESVKLGGFADRALDLGSRAERLAFASPEQAAAIKARQAEATFAPSIDLYALGALLFRAVIGRSPVEAPSTTALIDAIIQYRALPLGRLAPQLPPALAKLIDDLLSKDAAARPDAFEARAILTKIAADQRSIRPPASAPNAPQATMVAQQSVPPPGGAALVPRAAPTLVGLAFGLVGAAGLVALVAMRAAASSAPRHVDETDSSDARPRPSARPSTTPIASTSAAPPRTSASSSVAPPIMTYVRPTPSIEVVDPTSDTFTCGPVACKKATHYCLARGDVETTFQCVPALECDGPPSCSCISDVSTCQVVGGAVFAHGL